MDAPAGRARSGATSGDPSDSHSLVRSHSSPNQVYKTKWTAEEDALLTEAILKNGIGHWSITAESVPGRSGKQCRERWINKLSPENSADSWTEAEDAILIQKQQEFGNSWSRIAQSLPGRPANAVKNRWKWLSKQTQPIIAQEETQANTPNMPESLFPELCKAGFVTGSPGGMTENEWRAFCEWTRF
jgi:hypothetical protein